MSTTRIVAIPQRTADLVRSTKRSPGYGHPAHTEIAAGYGPCRLCLQAFAQGVDTRTLFTFDEFYDRENRPLPGPIFIHEQECTRYSENAGFPEGLRFLDLTINAYGRPRRLLEQAYVNGSDAEGAFERLLRIPNVDYLHVRNTEAGCYLFRVEKEMCSLDTSN